MAEKTRGRPSRGAGIIYGILWGVVFLLALSLLAGTLYALVFRTDRAPDPRGPQNGGTAAPLSEDGPPVPPAGQTFAGIGRIRAATAPPQPATVIFSITFPYDPEDRVFAEELASRIRDFRQAALEYFGSFPAEELRSLDEDEIKTELLRRYNALLRLGRIEVLYISDFMIF